MPGVSDHMLAALSASQAAPLLPLHRPRAGLLEFTALARGRSLDAALVSPGRRTPFPTVDPAYVDMSQGMSFCLANNIWGTNCARPPMLPHSSVHACQGAASDADLRAVAGAADVMWTPYAEQPADMRFRFEILAHDADAAAGAGAGAAGVTAATQRAAQPAAVSALCTHAPGISTVKAERYQLWQLRALQL